MRSLKTAQTEKYHSLVLSYINLIFGRKSKSANYWLTVVKDSIKKRFPEVLSEEESAATFDLRNRVYIRALYSRLQDLLGFRLRSTIAETQMEIDSESKALTLTTPLSMGDLLELYPTVKYLHRIHFEEGTALSKQATEEAKENVDFSEKLFEEAEKRYKESIKTKSDDYRGTLPLPLLPLHSCLSSLTLCQYRYPSRILSLNYPLLP